MAFPGGRKAIFIRLFEDTMTIHSPAHRRTAFTLIELLVVIAIIIILASLTLVVVSRIWQRVEVQRTTVEISKLSEACEQFKSTFGRYPRARILLVEGNGSLGSGYGPYLASGVPGVAQLAAESVEYLQAIFPGIVLDGSFIHDWNGNGVSNEFFLLEGEEALVFWLGGMRYGTINFADPVNGLANRSAALGFNTNKQTPTVNSTGTRLGPFYEGFTADRMMYTYFNPALNGLPRWNADPAAGPAGPSGQLNSRGWFPCYTDRYGMPFIYFSAVNGSQNNYRNSFNPDPGNGIPASVPAWLPAAVAPYLYDCAIITGNFTPYWQAGTASGVSGQSNIQFYKPDRYQIISAGRDRTLGSGGRYDPRNPEQYLTNPADHDNITNISEGRLVP